MAASSASSKSSAVGSALERDLLVDDQPDRRGGVRGQQPERVGVADDRDPPAARQRLVGEQLGDVEHVLERVDLDHPGLPEHRVDRLRRRRDRARRVPHRARPGWSGPERTATIGLRSETRRAMRENLRGLPIDSRYIITTSVDSSSSQYCSRSLPDTSARLPALTNVRQPEPAVVDLLQDRRPERTGLAEEPGPAARRHQRRERRVDRHRRVGVDDAQRVRPDQPQAVGPGQPDQLALPLPALLAGLGEARGDHHQPVHALGGAVEHDVGHRLGRHRDDRHVDVVVDLVDRLVRRQPGHGGGAGVHRVDPAGEVAGHQVAHQGLPDRVLAAAGADDRDRPRVEEPVDGRRLGLVLAALHPPDRGVGRVDRELQLQHPLVVLADHPVAGVAEGLDHPRGCRAAPRRRTAPRRAPGRPGRGARAAAGRSPGPGAGPRRGTPPRPPAARRRRSGPTAMIWSCRVTTSATRPTWSTWVNRSTSRSDRCGIGEKNR